MMVMMSRNCSQVISLMTPLTTIIIVFSGFIPQNRSVVLAHSSNKLAFWRFYNHHTHSKVHRMPDDLKAFFDAPGSAKQRQYEALRAYVLDGLPAKEVAQRFGFSEATVYKLAHQLRSGTLPLFSAPSRGPQKPTRGRIGP